MKTRFVKGQPLLKKPTEKMLVGLKVSWTDSSPQYIDIGDCSLPTISHKNPAFNMVANAWFNVYQESIGVTTFDWAFECDVVYKIKPKADGSNTKIDRLERPIVIRGKLALMAKEVNAEFEKALYASRLANSFYADGDKNKGEYLRCELSAKIIGV
jgi:hypothetical protein